MAYAGTDLISLNNFMNDIPSGKIVPELFTWSTLYEAMKSKIDKGEHVGDNWEILIQTTTPLSGTAMGENVDIVRPRAGVYTKMLVPLAEVQTNIGITRQAMKRAKGGAASWQNIVTRQMDHLLEVDFPWLMELSAYGDGTGRLARVLSVANDGATTTVTCDNTYTDFGIENTQMIKKGMLIQILASDGTTKRSLGNITGGAAVVTGVTAGYRTAAGSYAPATGTFTFADTSTRSIADGDVVYLAGVQYPGVTASGDATDAPPDMTEYAAGVAHNIALPMGLLGLVQEAAATDSSTAPYLMDSATDYRLTTFQNVTRANYETLLSVVKQGADYGGTDGTPGEWALTDVTNVITEIQHDTGGKVDAMFCHPFIAMALYSLNKAENGFNIVVDNTKKLNNQDVVGNMVPTYFNTGDRLIPIITSATMPRHCLFGVTTEDLDWRTLDNFDWMRLEGDIWMKSPDDRKTNYEAPYGGFTNVAAERCDRHFVMLDLRHDM